MKQSAWWQHGIVYQVYPRSFQDSDGDGVGDLRGILRRLDYLEWLGVDAVWISPIYPSPMADFGYDISDYTGIHPMFGSMADFEALLAAIHARGMKLILDFVPNHTSDRHPWFLESRSSRDNPKRDWYIWRDPAPDGGPPNNWLATFGGSGWEFDATTGQYYYHAFLKEQPDLNWRNPDVVAAMHDVLRFWLDKGVDGFRVDVIWHLIKDDQFRDNPPDYGPKPDAAPHRELLPVHSADRPEVHDVIAGLRQVVDAYDDRVLIGEIYLPLERLVAYYGGSLEGLHLPFNFALIQAPWEAGRLKRLVDEYESLLPAGGWPNWVLGNHDKSRIATRVGPAQARIAAMLLLTLRGTPTLYYGDEIGMQDVPVPPERVQDPFEKNVPGLGLGRDPQRTPMQWDDGPNAGFTAGEPWLPIASDWRAVNVAAQRQDPRSMLMFHRALIELRRREAALAIGQYRPVAATGSLFAFERQHGDRRLLVALNFGEAEGTLRLPADTEVDALLITARGVEACRPGAHEIALAGGAGVVVSLRRAGGI